MDDNECYLRNRNLPRFRIDHRPFHKLHRLSVVPFTCSMSAKPSEKHNREASNYHKPVQAL